ncbi:hypothetical protein ABH975_006727 [Bradyrhizobium ottawaense]
MKSGTGWELNQCEQADVTKLLDFRTNAKRFIFFAQQARCYSAISSPGVCCVG